MDSMLRPILITDVDPKFLFGLLFPDPHSKRRQWEKSSVMMGEASSPSDSGKYLGFVTPTSCYCFLLCILSAIHIVIML